MNKILDGIRYFFCRSPNGHCLNDYVVIGISSIIFTAGIIFSVMAVDKITTKYYLISNSFVTEMIVLILLILCVVLPFLIANNFYYNYFGYGMIG